MHVAWQVHGRPVWLEDQMRRIPKERIRQFETAQALIAPRRQELSKLCESDVPPGVFYGELLKKLL